MSGTQNRSTVRYKEAERGRTARVHGVGLSTSTGLIIVGKLRHLGCDLVAGQITASLRLSFVTDSAHSATTPTVRRDSTQRYTEHTLRLPKTRPHFVCSEEYFEGDKIRKD